MDDLPRRAGIVVVGGGVMGSSTAYHLAARGMKDVVLLEREESFGQGATGRCAGGVRYQFATEVNVRLSLESLPMLERFRDELGQEINYRQCGYLLVCTNEDDAQAFARNVELQRRLGVQTEWLTGDEVRRRLPLMQFEDAVAGTFHQKDGLVDPNSVVMGYIGAARRLGVRAHSGVTVVGLSRGGGDSWEVRTGTGTMQAPLVVNAAGPWSAQIGQMAGVEIPVVPIRRQMFTTTPIPQIPSDFPFVIDFAQSLYFHREGEGLLIGMSNPNQGPGHDQRVDSAFELVNLECAARRLPSLETAGIVSSWAGLYEVTPDAHPIFGQAGPDGFYVVAGFSGHGFMHGPIAGKLMSELILDGEFRTVDVSGLDLRRFEEGRMIREYNVV
jgi:sarcosine oxidase subunit beta